MQYSAMQCYCIHDVITGTAKASELLVCFVVPIPMQIHPHLFMYFILLYSCKSTLWTRSSKSCWISARQRFNKMQYTFICKRVCISNIMASGALIQHIPIAGRRWVFIAFQTIVLHRFSLYFPKTTENIPLSASIHISYVMWMFVVAVVMLWVM